MTLRNCFIVMGLAAAWAGRAWGDLPATTMPEQAATIPETQAEMPAPSPANVRMDDQLLDWYGLRTELSNRGLTVAGTDILDYSKDLSGPSSRSNIVRNLVDLRLTLDMNAAVKLPGASVSMDMENFAGPNGSSRIRDVQGFDSIDSPNNRTQIDELWYQQYLLDNHFRIKAGKMDANTDFDQPTYTSLFYNGSWGESPTIEAFPTYPDNAVGVNVFVYPADWIYAGAGVYDGGGPTVFRIGAYGPAKIFHSGESAFAIGEVGVKWSLENGNLPGRIAVGGSYDDRRFTALDGPLASKLTHSGAGSFYAIAEQQVWHTVAGDKNNPAGIYATFQYGYGDPHVSEFVDHYGFALVWTAPYAKMNPDSLGVGVSMVRLSTESNSPALHSYETAFEGYYNYQITKYLALRPDLQYILDPGASRQDHAVVASLRLVLNF